MIALVTGANKGIGLEVVRQLADLGHTIILSSRNRTRGLNALEKFSSSYPVVYHQLDVSDQQSIQAIYDFVLSEYGRLDILINNAGINYDTWHDTLNADLNNVKETLDTNLFGAWAMLQKFIPLMQKNGYGRVVNVSSGSGTIQGMSAGTPGYAISKAALNILTIKASALVNNSNILINSVCPGWVRTDMGGMMASRSVEKGAETIIWAALLEKNGPSGMFFRDKKVVNF